MSKIIVNMITHEDAIYMPVVIPALHKFADQVIVTDNGSLDRTVGLLQSQLRLTDKIIYNPNNNTNLGEVRNKMIEMVDEGDWVFKWDSDELPSDQMISSLRLFLDSHDEVGWGVPCYHIHQEPQHALSFEFGFHHMCLFKKTSQTRYQGAVHSVVVGTAGKVSNIPLDTGISIIHFSYWARRRFREKAVFYTTQEGSGFTTPNDLLQRLDWPSEHLPSSVTYSAPAAWMEKLRNAS